MKNNFESDLAPFVSDAIGRYSQFTVDFAQREVAKEDINNEQMLALEYRIDNVITIMNPALPDYSWFLDLKAFVSKITAAYLEQERFVGNTLRLMAGEN